MDAGKVVVDEAHCVKALSELSALQGAQSLRELSKPEDDELARTAATNAGATCRRTLEISVLLYYLYHERVKGAELSSQPSSQSKEPVDNPLSGTFYVERHMSDNSPTKLYSQVRGVYGAWTYRRSPVKQARTDTAAPTWLVDGPHAVPHT